jgi:hypothetical protein
MATPHNPATGPRSDRQPGGMAHAETVDQTFREVVNPFQDILGLGGAAVVTPYRRAE